MRHVTFVKLAVCVIVAAAAANAADMGAERRLSDRLTEKPIHLFNGGRDGPPTPFQHSSG